MAKRIISFPKTPVRSSEHLLWIWIACVVVLVTAGILAYLNSFQGVFLLDDRPQIVDNERIRSLQWPWQFWEGTRRPVLYLSLAVNYAFGKLDVGGYHLFNLIVHLANAVLLFVLIRKTLALKTVSESFQRSAWIISFLSALLWVVHPLLTQAVTYIIQRAESLAAFFVLLTILSAISYFLTHQKRWLIACALFCLAGGLTKETMLTVPIIILLYDRIFIFRSLKDILRRHWALYCSFIPALIVMLVLFVKDVSERNPTAGFAYKGISPLWYALNQPAVILHYLKLSFWPHPLVFDYLWPASHDVNVIFPSLCFILFLIGFLIWNGRRMPWLGFLGGAFFLLLIPSSGFIPLKDLAFEYRMYLPLCCVVVLFVVGLHWSIPKIFSQPIQQQAAMLILGVMIAIGLGFMTHVRNKDYHGDIRMWQDVVEKRPLNARAYNNLGERLMSSKDKIKAFSYYLHAIALDPLYDDPYVNIGTEFAQREQLDDAIVYYRKALDLNPDHPYACANIATAYYVKRRYEEAIVYYKRALELGFGAPDIYLNTAIAMVKTDRLISAKAYFLEALKFDPGSSAFIRGYLAEIDKRLSQQKAKDEK